MQELIVASNKAVLLNLFEAGLVVEEIRDMAFVGPYLIQALRALFLLFSAHVASLF